MKIVQTTAGFNGKGEMEIDNLPVITNNRAGIIFLLPEQHEDNPDAFSDYYVSYNEETIIVNDEGVSYNPCTEGDVVLVELPQSAGAVKLRPAVVLKQMPSYNDFLICGISSQQHHYLENFDELMDEGYIAFAETGLHKNSVIRLSALAVFSAEKIMYTIGKIPGDLHKALLQRLAAFLIK